MNAPKFITITSASEVCGILNSNNYCTAQSKNGSTVLSIFISDGSVMCTAKKYGKAREHHEFKRTVQVVKWAYRWLKEIKEIDSYENRN